MWVAQAQHPNLPLRPRGESVSPPTLQLHLCAQRDGGPGPWAREENCRKGGEERRPPAVREIRDGGYSEDHALPWAAHTLTHLRNTHGCPNIHTRHRRISQKPEGKTGANNKASIM